MDYHAPEFVSHRVLEIVDTLSLQRTLLIQQSRRIMRDLLVHLRFPAPFSHLIDHHSRPSKWSNEKRLSIHTSSVFFATSGSGGTSIMQPKHAALKDLLSSLFPYPASATCSTAFGKADETSSPP